MTHAATQAIHKLYTRDILRLAGGISLVGRLDGADGEAIRTSRLCGSTIAVAVRVDGDARIADYAQQVRACAFGQASASLFAEVVVGLGADDVSGGQASVQAFLKGGSEPEGRWAGFSRLAPVLDVPARHGAVLLPFEATLAALQAASAT